MRYQNQSGICGWLATAVVLALCAIGCDTRPVQKQEVPGVYRVNYDFGGEVLTLWPNGRYDRVFTYSNGTIVQGSGTWRFFADLQFLTLDDYVTLDDGFGRQATPPFFTGARAVNVRRRGGKVALQHAAEGDDYKWAGPPPTTAPTTGPSTAPASTSKPTTAPTARQGRGRDWLSLLVVAR